MERSIYKIGDKVRAKTGIEIDTFFKGTENSGCSLYYTQRHQSRGGQILTVKNIHPFDSRFFRDETDYWWHVDMAEPVVKRDKITVSAEELKAMLNGSAKFLESIN